MAAINKTQKYNIEKICRACLQIKKDMRPLFEQLTATMLMGISKVQVAVGDGLPSQLCLQCVHQISRCHAFKDLVERNDATLREQVKVMAAETLKKDEELADPNQYIEFIEVPNLNNTASQLLDSFFPETSSDTNVTQEILNKDDFDVDKLEPTNTEAKTDDGLNSDEENYLQMVVFQATSSVAPGRHVCNLCQKEFKYAKWLKMHMQSHSNWIKANCKKPPMCPICERTFKGPGMLKMHMRTHEQRPPKQPTCSVCQRTFPTKTLLYRHRQTHFEQKTHHCTVCEKRFFSGYALRSHMARHRGERPYICSICLKSFYNPTDLKVHFRLHTGEKPLKCSECNKTFRRHSTLCQHMKKHKGIRNHVCNICNKAFYEVSKLNAHMRVHTGERPFECQYCSRKFAQQSALIYHKRTHTGEKPYACRSCPARFTTSSSRNNHMLTHQGNKNESTKASTAEVQIIKPKKKTNAQKCREYRERKKLQNALVQNIPAARSDEYNETDLLQAKRPRTNAERRKKHYEAQKLKKQGSKKIPKTVKQKNKEYYERKKQKQILNLLNHHSDAFVCPVCFKGCSSRTELRVHSAKHTGEKLLACEVCSQRFSSHAHLTAHRRTHAHTCGTHAGRGTIENNIYKKNVKSHTKEKSPADEVKSQTNDEDDQKDLDSQLEINEEEKIEDKPDVITETEIIQDGQIVIQENGSQKRFKCGLCVKSYTYLHSLKKHMLSHVQMCVYSPDGSERMYAFKQQQQEQQQQQLQQLQQVVQVGGVSGVQQLAVPVHPHVQPLVSQVQSGQQYPVISSVQLQQTHQQINTQPQLQVQTIQIHPQHQPIQIHAVGVQQVQQVQQEQLHVATSSCQTMVPNILQLQPGAVVSGLGQELGGVHRIILQPPHAHPHTLYTLHH